MKEYIKNLLFLFLVMFFTTSVFIGIKMPTIPIYYIATIFVLITTIMVTKPLLKFLTIKTNFLTHLLMSTLLLVGTFFLLRIFMTDFNINVASFSGINWDFLQINGFEISPILTICFASVSGAFLSSIFYTLEKKD